MAVTSDPVVTRASSAPGLMRRLLRRPLSVMCIVYLVFVVGVAIVAPIALPNVASQNAGNGLLVNQGPSIHHLLGTDTLGRDVLQRLLVGTRVTMLGVGEALLVVLLLGVPLGLIAGYFGGWIDRLVGAVSDVAFAIPGIIVVLVVLSVYPESMLAAMCAFGILMAPGLMRVVRSATLPVREELYVSAAQVSGLTSGYIIRRHILPRIAGVVIVQASLLAATALLVQSSLAFLGLLVAEPAPSWGGMVANGVSVLELQPWLIWPPGLAIAFTILALGLLGDGVRDATTAAWVAPARARPKSRRRIAMGRVDEAPGPRDIDASPSLDDPATQHAVLSVEHLSVSLATPTGRQLVVDDVSFDVQAGEAVGLVGESGCGKTVTAMAILGLVAADGRVDGGRALFNGANITGLTERQLRRIRGTEIGFVSQDPMIGLTPSMRIGAQLAECVRHHRRVSRRSAKAKALELISLVQIADAETVARRYPHELSGGMAQRIAIARALAGEPKLLIADEPTTALDVTIQAEILRLLRDLQQERQMALLLVTHDWGVVADICDRAVVMYAGEIVERADLIPIFHTPLHPYTKALLEANPHNNPEAAVLPTIPGSVPELGSWPKGCRFHPRCALATDACADGPVLLDHPLPDRETRCIHYDELVGISR